MLSVSQLRQAGRQALRQSYFERAIESFAEVALRCDDEASHFELADAYARAENYPLALRHFQRALTFSPQRVRTINQLALVYGQLAQWDLAILWHLKAIEYAPDDVKAYRHLAEIYLRNNQTALAVRWLSRVLNMTPDDHTSRFNLALLCLKNGLESEAAALLSEIVTDNQAFAPAWVELAELSERAGSPESALACWQQALIGDAQEQLYVYQALRLARQLGQTDLAEQLHRQLSA